MSSKLPCPSEHWIIHRSLFRAAVASSSSTRKPRRAGPTKAAADSKCRLCEKRKKYQRSDIVSAVGTYCQKTRWSRRDPQVSPWCNLLNILSKTWKIGSSEKFESQPVVHLWPHCSLTPLPNSPSVTTLPAPSPLLGLLSWLSWLGLFQSLPFQCGPRVLARMGNCTSKEKDRGGLVVCSSYYNINTTFACLDLDEK